VSTLEIIATISTILCVWLTGKNNILCWPAGIISALSLIGAYVQTGMYAQITLQSVFFIQSIIGWYNWAKPDGITVSSIKRGKIMMDLISFVALGCMFAGWDVIHNNKIELLPSYLDGISASIALLGNWYLTKKIIEAWPLFVIYNSVLAVVLFSQGLYLLVGLNVFLVIISINSFIKWRRGLQTV